jgi:hypothetical protein
MVIGAANTEAQANNDRLASSLGRERSDMGNLRLV